MSNVRINLTSQPTLPNGVILDKGSWVYTSQGLKSNKIDNSEQTSGYIKFNTKGGSVVAKITSSSEVNFDFMMLHVSQSSSPPSRNTANMANLSGFLTNTYSYYIGAEGTYYLHFSYAKDSSSYDGDDCGWIEYVDIPLAASGTVYTNVNGVWKQGEQYINAGGVWKQGIPYVNVNGVWKQSTS